MGRMSIILPDDIEERFRRACIEKFGLKRGKVYNGFREAITLFIKSVEGDSYKEIIIQETTPGQEPELDKQETQTEFKAPPSFSQQLFKIEEPTIITVDKIITDQNDFKIMYDNMAREELIKEFGSLSDSDPLYSQRTQHIAKRLTELITNNISAPKQHLKKPDSEYLQ